MALFVICYTFFMQTKDLVVDGQKVAANLFLPARPNGEGVLFIHGWRSSKESPRVFAETLATIGYTSLTFDLRGMGVSEGDASVLSRADFLKDCIAAYDALVTWGGVGSVSVVGSSFGSYMACLLTGSRPIKRLVLRVPANYPNEGYDTCQAVLSDRLDAVGLAAERPVGSTYALDLLRAFSGQVLIVQSGNDKIIHPETVKSFADAVANKSNLAYRVMQDAPHSLSASPELVKEYADILMDWFSSK